METLQQRLAIPSHNFPGVLPTVHTSTMITAVNILFHPFIDVQNVLLILSPIKIAEAPSHESLLFSYWQMPMKIRSHIFVIDKKF